MTRALLASLEAEIGGGGGPMKLEIAVPLNGSDHLSLNNEVNKVESLISHSQNCKNLDRHR
jgi:hypothetical protein